MLTPTGPGSGNGLGPAYADAGASIRALRKFTVVPTLTPGTSTDIPITIDATTAARRPGV